MKFTKENGTPPHELSLKNCLSDIAAFARKLLSIPDQKKAEKQIEEYVREKAQAVTFEEREQLEQDIKDSKEKVAPLKASIAEQRKLVRNTDKTVLVRDQQAIDDPDKKQRWWRKFLDVLLAIICFLLACVALGISMSTMFTVVMSSGNPVFLEKESLAWAMSSILALGALAFEFFKRYLVSDKAKRRYGIGMYGVCVILLLIWIVMFAIIFGSIADQGISTEDLLDVEALTSSGQDPWMTAFTVVQLLVEFFIGCSFFLTSGSILSKYSPTRRIENPIYIDAKAQLDKMEAEFETLRKDLTQKEARLGALKAAVSLFIKERTAEYAQSRARMGW